MQVTTNNQYFLSGGGEMGELIRAKDWSKTSLGDPNFWPQSLCTTVAIMLENPFGMYIAWGDDYTQLYNDGYRPILGKSKHPKALGISTRDTFSEIWNIIGSMFDGVMKGVPIGFLDFMLPLNRNGFVEECYFHFSYSPIRKENGAVGGVLVTVIETTEKKRIANALQESNTRFINNIMQAPVAMCIFRGENHVVEIANEQMLALWEKNANQVMNKPIFEGLPEAKNQGLEDLINSVFTTGTKFEANERPVQLRNGKTETTYINFVYEALRETDGSISGVVAIATEVTDQVMARQKIEEVDKKFREMVKQAPVGITILRGSEFVVEMANEAFLRLASREEVAILGKPLFESLPEAKDAMISILAGVLSTGIPYQGNEVPIPINRYGTEAIFNFDFLYNPLKEDDGKISGIIASVTEVTEKVEARKKIQQNEERLKIVVEASELGTWELNLKTNTPNYSKRYLEIIGGYKEKVELTHQQIIGHLHPDDMLIRENAFQKALTSGYLGYEARVIWNDQSMHWIEGKGKVFYDKDHQPLKMIGTLRDITEEKQREQELQESEQKFRLLASSLPQQIWTSDPEGNFNYYNKSVFDYSGLTPKQINKNGWIALLHPDDRKGSMNAWQHAIATGTDFLFEHRFKRHDGEHRWQLSLASAQKDEKGKIQMWVGTSTDIQDQKVFTNQLEKQVNERTRELNMLNESLRKSEERYHLMIEDVQDYAILYLNHLGIIESWNKGVEKIKGYAQEEIIGKDFSVFYTEQDKKNDLPQKLLDQANQEGRASQEGWRVRKNGTLFWASVVITAIKNEQNEVVGFSKVTHDLSEKKRANDQLRLKGFELVRKNIALDKMNKELQSFTYISSHDLQEPLRKIQTFALQLMEKELHNLSANGKDKFQRMYNAAQRMQTLISDLLTYSRTNIQDRTFIKTDLCKIIDDVKADLKEELELKEATLEIRCECEVEIIPFQMRQLLYNLISNSLKFSKAGTKPEVIINGRTGKGEIFEVGELKNEETYCHIHLSDNGIGFAPEYKDRIFGVFQRLHGRSEYAGTGIGLAIVKKIVDNHNGYIEAAGEPNAGAVFNIYLPVDQ